VKTGTVLIDIIDFLKIALEDMDKDALKKSLIPNVTNVKTFKPDKVNKSILGQNKTDDSVLPAF